MQNSNPFELFKQELQNDESSFRINTIHKIPIICTLVSPETIKSSLLPYLQSLIKREDDEIVFAIAEQLASVAPFLGAQHTVVLPYLQSLCAHDETVVRDRAVTSISKLCQKYSDNQISNFIIPLIIRLATNESNFTFRVSAVHLLCKVYPRAGNHKQKLRQKFLDISNEQMLLLQRVTTIKIVDLCHIYEKQYILQDIISILKQRSSDQKNQDQIRALAVQSFKDISKVLSRDENKAFMMPLIIQAAQDKSWRVRLCLSKNFPQIAANFGKQMTDMSLIQTLGNLLKDSEVDVKIQAVKSLKSFVKVISPEKINVLVPQILNLGKDSLGIVRANVGLAIKTMLQAISKDQAYQHLLPLIKELMKDDSQQVRKGGIQAAAKFVQILGPQTISSLSTNIKTCSEDPKWRVRLELLRNISNLSIKLENYDFFIKHIEPIYLNYLKDRASAIRILGISMISPLAKCFGDEWISSFIPKLEQVILKQTSYHFIISAIYSLKQICICPLGEHYLDKCLSSLIKTCSNSVPNVREVSIKSLRDIGFAIQKASVRQNIKKQLSLMQNDSDSQIKMTINQTLAKF